MDFDSLKISENENSKRSLSAVNYSNMAKNIETRTSEERLKVNNTELKMNLDKQYQQQKSDDIKQDGENTYKGNYSKENLENAIKIANEKIKKTSRQFSYSIHDKTKQVIISVKDSDGKIIKEIPSEESLDFFAKLQELSGILLDEKW